MEKDRKTGKPAQGNSTSRGIMGFIFFIMGFAGGLAWGIRELRRLRTRYLQIGQDCRDLISDNARLRYQNRQLAQRNDIEITEDELAELARRNS